jgi:hypothetical protein
MKNYLNCFFVAIILATGGLLNAQTTVINTNFDDYTVGDLSGQILWDGDDAAVVTTADYVKTGSNGVQLGTGADIHYVAYDKNTTGLTATVYMDTWVKVTTAPGDGYFQITGRDLTPDGSGKRNFMFEFTSSLEIRAYNGSSKSVIGSYIVGEWVRVSFSADYGALTYDVAVNGTVVLEDLDFREDYVATEKDRATDTKEFHSIRFLNDDNSNLATAAIGSVYVGEEAISDIAFAAPATTRTISIDQPEKGEITLSPVKTDNIYEIGDTVVATISGVPEHYVFDAWTGALTSSIESDTIFVSSSVTLGANIIIDSENPPTEFTIDLIQTTGGTISVKVTNDDDAEEQYEGLTCYEGTEVTFTATSEIGYEFTSWNGITGDTDDEDVTVTQSLTVSAVFTEGTFTPRTINVSSVGEFEDAVDDLQPGDHIIVADGDYDGFGDNFDTKGGTEAYPVLIEAATVGGVNITGGESLTFENSAYITIKGFNFDVEVYTLFKLTDCNNIRITQNTFKNSGDGGSKLILIGGEWDASVCLSNNNRIDHNLFDGKTDGGAWLVIDGSHGGTPQVSQYDSIDHNHFRFNQTRADNEKETIRIGMSDLSLSSAYCTVEDNLFEECDGDPEIISVKSCDNYIRNNTFIKCLGTVSLRHGNGTEVSGNYFFGNGKTAQFTNDENETSTIGCGGVRMYGKDHKIFNNYFEGLTGTKWDAAITLTEGDATNTNVTNSSDLTKHYIPEDIEITHNTIINCAEDIGIGYASYGKAPKNVLIANNIIVENANQVVTVHATGMEDEVYFENNIFYTTGTGTWGDIVFTAAEAINEDPELVLTNGRVLGNNAAVPTETYKLSSNSIAIDPDVTVYSYVTTDAEGQASINARDLGADEYNASQAVTNGALDASHVGPNAVLFEEANVSQYSITLNSVTGGTISVSPEALLYNDGSTVTFTATPDDGYTFTSWSGIAGTTASETMFINSNLTVGAIFTEGGETAIDETEATIQLSVYPNPFEGTTSIFVDGEAQATVYTMSGQQIDAFEFVNSYEWTAPKNGVYFAVITTETAVSTIKLIAK